MSTLYRTLDALEHATEHAIEDYRVLGWPDAAGECERLLNTVLDLAWRGSDGSTTDAQLVALLEAESALDDHLEGLGLLATWPR